MFKTSFLNRQKLPLVIEPQNDAPEVGDFHSLLNLCERERQFLERKLLETGALLFRGFKISTEEDFETFVRVFSRSELRDYRGGASPRVRLKGAVYTSTEYPPEYFISLHNELSYSDKYPSRVYFCCLIAPAIGGETPIADSRRILRALKPEIVRLFKEKQIKYVRNLHGGAGDGYSWQDVFDTHDKFVVEAICRGIEADVRWKSDGGLQISEIRPATVKHTATGDEVWFNQAENFHPSAIDAETRRALRLGAISEEDFRLNSFFGDGSPINVALLEHIRAVCRDEMILFPWQTGDCLVLDNLLAAHGRMPFAGGRKIVVAMT
jgi:hypothetical protein